MTESEDIDLIERFQAGDTQSFDLLYQKYVRLIGKISSEFFIQGADRDDVFQEGLIGFFLAVRDFDKSRTFLPFAYVCIRRRIFTAIKTSDRKKHQPLNKSVDLSHLYQEQEFSKSELVEESVIEDEEQELLYKYLSRRLSKLELKVFCLYTEGYPLREIAKKLDCSVKSVDGAVFRAKTKLLKEEKWKIQ